MKKVFLILFVAIVGVLAAHTVSAVDCWNITTESSCTVQSDCSWNSDIYSPSGGWCNQKGCWNFWTQTTCENSTNSINKTCSWQSSSSGWCSQLDCWAFDGTTAASCVNNSYGITCSWRNECSGPYEKNCWSYTVESDCKNVTGCKWGMCSKQDCWSYTNQASCILATGYGGQCQWNTQYSYCYQSGCWDYTNKTACEANNCSWSGGYCNQKMCSDWSYTNTSTCENNTANLSCSWSNPWCNQKGCWNYQTQASCNAINVTGMTCFWETYNSGWCQEVGCWSWENNQTGCENQSYHLGLSCAYQSPWCFENITSKTCSDIAGERNCMDTFYCFWNYSSSTCNEPVAGETETFHQEWNPGCYIFDSDHTACINTTGCYLCSQARIDEGVCSTTGKCETNLTRIPSGQLNCSLINNQTVCNKIPVFGTCCKWQAGSCVEDKWSTTCRDEMTEPPEGAYYCDDYNSYTDSVLCGQISGYPWYMPCMWDSATERCTFQADKVFGSGEKNVMRIDSEQNCIAAGGNWHKDSYCEGSVAVPVGSCEFRFDDERNCNKECYACDYKTDKTNWSSATEAKQECVESLLGFCKFTTDSTAPNGFGYCNMKDEIKKGLVSGDCENDCGACTYMGDATASKPENRPSYFCTNSKAKCKWIADPAYPTDESKGRCASSSEKKCEDRCDKCYEESVCTSKGAKKGNESASTQCTWSNGICMYTSGADQLEICWDGTDNNADGKMDCADSMCWSDPFCGGNFMMGTKDCFGYTDNASCSNANCTWMNENWGTWCDMPGANCWKFDGTDAPSCEAQGCEWHSGGTGICEENWNKGDTCMNYDKTTCENATGQGNNCTWVVDSWCQNYGGMCDPDPSWTGAWYNCAQHDMDGNVSCESHEQCSWYIDPWCAQQGADAGHCDHRSFTCWNYNLNASCTNTSNNNNLFCTWMFDMYSPNGGYCNSKTTSGGSESCWDKNTQPACEGAGCNWVSGLCDPKGFGSATMGGGGGMGAGGGAMMGGSGMSCFKYDGNITLCQNQTGCGWFDELAPFCEVDFSENCPEYSYDQTQCSNKNKCKWNPDMSFCDVKAFQCNWNSTLRNNETACNNNSLCHYSSWGSCEPICFNKSTEGSCKAVAGCRWVSGWCNPGMAAQFFKGMEGGALIPLGTDSSGDASLKEIDILDFGLKDMGSAFGFGIHVNDISNAAACNGIKLQNGVSGTGQNTTKFYWYLDTDGNHDNSNGCKLQHNATIGGYEFFIKSVWSWNNLTGEASEASSAYKCSSGNWTKAEIKLSSVKQKMCKEIGGGLVGIEKADMEKYPSLYSAGTDMRVYVVSANATANETSPTDIADLSGWVTPGAMDFDIGGFNFFKFESNATKKAGKEGNEGFVDYYKVDCWTAAGCADYKCMNTTYCVENQLGVHAPGFEDTRAPKVIGIVQEAYYDSAFIAYFTDKPANGTLEFWGPTSTCPAESMTAIIPDIALTSATTNNYKLWHVAKIYEGAPVLYSYPVTNATNYTAPLASNVTYYFKLKICDQNGKCGTSKCTPLATATTGDCPFCNFVTRIDAPTGWNVSYDLDQDGTYEHAQGQVCGPNAGLKTNHSSGRFANIRLTKSDNSTYIEFINVTLTRSGLSHKTRKIDTSDSLTAGTTTDEGGSTLGYTGMISKTRDQIVNNLFPEKCFLKIPRGDGNCTEIWHCDDDLGNCVNKTSKSTINTIGTNYCVWQIPCEFSTWSGGDPSGGGSGDDGGDGGGGGGGGGGGSANATLPSYVLAKVSKMWASIDAGATATMSISNLNIDFTELNIKVKNGVVSPSIAVQSLKSKPTGVAAPSSLVYQYLEIKPTNIQSSDINYVSISYRVKKSWLTEKGVTEDDIRLYRYTTNAWTALTVMKTGEDDTYVNYKSTSGGFSYFAIGAEKAGCTEAWNCSEWSECSTDGKKTRTCVDSNNCGTTASMPEEAGDCIFYPSEPVVEEKPKVEGAITEQIEEAKAKPKWAIIIGIVVLLAAVIGFVYEEKRIKKDREAAKRKTENEKKAE